MRLVKFIKIVVGLGVLGLGTVAVAQKGGASGTASHPVSPPPSRPQPTGNNPNYNTNYNLPTNNVYAPYGYPFGMDINAINASSSIAQQQRLRMAEQYRKLNQDMDKIMDLTKQLKMGVDGQPQGQIPPDLVKKAGEIEKLAKSIQSQQKG
jgi:hypothetical protein